MKADIECYGCGQVGHILSQCTRKRQKNKKRAPKKSQEKNSAHSAAASERTVLMCAFNEGTNSSSVSGTASSKHTYTLSEQASDTTVNDAGMNTNEICLNAKSETTKKNDSSNVKFNLDSGCTRHMANEAKYFKSLRSIDGVNILVAKKDESICAKQAGDIAVETYYNGDCSTKIIKDAIYSEDLQCNLLSIRCLTRNGFKIVFEGDFAYASLNGKIMFVAHAETICTKWNFKSIAMNSLVLQVRAT